MTAQKLGLALLLAVREREGRSRWQEAPILETSPTFRRISSLRKVRYRCLRLLEVSNEKSRFPKVSPRCCSSRRILGSHRVSPSSDRRYRPGEAYPAVLRRSPSYPDLRSTTLPPPQRSDPQDHGLPQ
jgi:hypothetical protein